MPIPALLSIRLRDSLITGDEQIVEVLNRDGKVMGQLTGVRKARYELTPLAIGKVVLELEGSATISTVEAF